VDLSRIPSGDALDQMKELPRHRAKIRPLSARRATVWQREAPLPPERAITRPERAMSYIPRLQLPSDTPVVEASELPTSVLDRIAPVNSHPTKSGRSFGAGARTCRASFHSEQILSLPPGRLNTLSSEDERKKRRKRERGPPIYPSVKEGLLPQSGVPGFLPTLPRIIEDSETTGYSLVVYADTHFRKNRQERRKSFIASSKGKDLTLPEMIIHSKKLPYPLHSWKVRDNDKPAHEMFDFIVSLMGDASPAKESGSLIRNPRKGLLRRYQSSSSNTQTDDSVDNEQLQQFLIFLLDHPALHDEFFAQILKQMTSNPKEAS
jgi:hypothetical protein